MNNTSLDDQMLLALLVAAAPHQLDGPPQYNVARDRNRARHPYSVTVDENLLTVQGGAGRFSDDDDGGIVIPLPFIRGVGSIHKRYTKGNGSFVNLRSFNITIVGQKEPVVICQGEPVWWHSASGEKNQALEDQEMLWHLRQLAMVRHNVLAELNAYINRVRELDPQNRQLKLGL